MRIKDEPNKITATMNLVVTGEFYDDEASEETLRYCIEQDLEDAGFDVNVTLLKEQKTNELKPCPFCGGKAVLEKMGWPHHVYCSKCGAKITSVRHDEDGEQEAIAKWNRRA